MSDDRIIDFNDLKNKVKDSDVDKFEQYIYNLYFSVMDGSMTMAEFSRKIFDYMKDNNISQEKFMNIQKKFMERYGMDSEEVEKQLKNFGIDPSIAGMNNIDLNNISSENLEAFKYSSNQSIVSLSKWLVGSSSINNSQGVIRADARETLFL